MRLPAFVLPVLLAACATVPEAPPAPPVPAAFANPASGDAAPVAEGRWWQAFGDPALGGLLQAVHEGHPQLLQARARARRADALARAEGAAAGPQLHAQGAATRQGGPLVNAAGNQGSLFNAGLTLAFDPTRGSLAAQAAAREAAAAAAELQAIALASEAEVVRAWLALAALADEEHALDELIALQERAHALQQARVQRGLAAAATLAAAEAERAALQAERSALPARRAALLHGLAQARGQAPADASPLPTPRPAVLPQVPAGLPAHMLARRADVGAAQARLQAALARQGLADATLWPALSLTASGGVAAPELGRLLQAGARSWGLGALFSLPLFDGGQREARRDAARAEVDEAAAAWRERVLVALREVDDELATLAALRRQADARDEGARQADGLLQAARGRRARGLVDEFTVLLAERDAVRARRAAARVQADRAQATVALVRALGGGWQAPSTLAGVQ